MYVCMHVDILYTCIYCCHGPPPPSGVYVDARRLTLQGGLQIIVLIKGGEAFIPNPELAKVLPVVSRTAMDQIRTQCGVTVTLASKGEIGEGGGCEGVRVCVCYIVGIYMYICMDKGKRLLHQN